MSPGLHQGRGGEGKRKRKGGGKEEEVGAKRMYIMVIVRTRCQWFGRSHIIKSWYYKMTMLSQASDQCDTV